MSMGSVGMLRPGVDTAGTPSMADQSDRQYQAGADSPVALKARISQQRALPLDRCQSSSTSTWFAARHLPSYPDQRYCHYGSGPPAR
jgi:hypothetical protein